MAKTYISSVLGNSQKLDGGSMFGNAPRAVWSRWIEPDELGRIPLACRAMLIEYEDKKILCETGIGAFFEPKLADRFGVQTPDRHILLESLESLDIKPEDIDYVILSHLHFDHAGGLLPSFKQMEAGNKDLVFKNAHYITSEVAFERAQHPHSRDRASFIPELPEKLKATGKLTLVKEGKPVKLFDGRLEFYFSYGHTPGQLLTIFHGDKEDVMFCGDLIPGRHWVHVPITMGYDRYPEKLIDEKKALYDQVNLAKMNFFFTHDHEVALAKIDQNDSGKYKVHSPESAPVRYEI